ncbi:hypothetical protein LPTSP2_37140 [Leptospira ellinghausenii]|uniref:Uncharacterized protein n=1 Tax=Leptospira ellinghausenii TaxID=1917822 RepID=A0A2P2DII3_9LEPT|nr:hypothetical protein [Leptospira ellinghausenii]GBF44411.1 hypothetical protein LPTSP2_37140 [Leptospira ellinghausenii]
MEFHEKTLELNITHELLTLADSWYWFLYDISLWKYWRPEWKLPFLNYKKSTSGGFHITTEGKNDPTGNAGGGYDVRIKAGLGGHLLFIQYKKGDLVKSSPSPESIFSNSPHEHYLFKINSTTTNQHFLLKNLANAEGSKIGNAVVYALPLIESMEDLENNAGKIISKTKFISVLEIDKQAANQNPPIYIKEDQEHNFRVCKKNMERCEVNQTFFEFNKGDSSKEIFTDIIMLNFLKVTKDFIKYFQNNRLNIEYIEIFELSLMNFKLYILNLFEVSINRVNEPRIQNILSELDKNERKNEKRSIEIVESIFSEIRKYEDLTKINEIPEYQPKFLAKINDNNIINLEVQNLELLQSLENLNYIQVG